MGTQTRLVSGLDPAADGLPFDPTIRIPPIQDPSPLQVISNHRPSPLEPSAGDGNHFSTTRLDSRSKALAAAQPLSGDSSLVPLDTSHIAASRRTEQEEETQLGPRKRQRVDYVQLPNPQKSNPLERNTSLDTVPRVNQLHEPPPSAARFPPIITNHASPHIGKNQPRDAKSSLSASRRAPKSQAEGESPPNTEEPRKTKRNYTRGRRMWTDEETEALLNGVARYGVGKWKRILNDPDFSFPPDRTAVDLKDRYRTCRMHEERKIERHANGDPAPDEPNPTGPSKGQRKARKSSPPEPKEKAPSPAAVPAQTSPAPAKPSTTGKRKKKDDDPKTDEQQPGINFASVNTVQDMADELAKRVEPAAPKWSAEDDSNLSRGFQKYGFHWTAISKDPELNLEDRTGPQLRDRFRVKFPIHYQSSVPIDLPEPAQGYDRDQRPRRRLAPKGGTKVSLATNGASKGAVKGARSSGQGQRSKNMSIADIIKPADAAQTPRIPKTSLPSVQSLCARVDAQPLPEPTSTNGTFIDIQELPEEGEEFDESEFDEDYSDHNEDGGDSPVEGDSADEFDEAVRAGDDVRHLGILGLLNDPEVEAEATAGHRLPPFKSTYDDTHEDWGQGSVTLPPLLLEAPRPLFELD